VYIVVITLFYTSISRFYPMQATRYPIPADSHRIETMVVDSRFIATGTYAPTLEAAEAFVMQVRAEYADATHNCIAYRVGYGPGAAERASDDGEPSGTAGRPMLAVLQGSNIGDIAVVVTRYFGGTKLGSGGLVRAYSGAVRALLAELPLKPLVRRVRRAVEVEYSRYEFMRRYILEREGEIESEDFAAEVTIYFTLPIDTIEPFDEGLIQWSHGQLAAVTLE
jgi:uncharacterized YigZ family protein